MIIWLKYIAWPSFIAAMKIDWTKNEHEFFAPFFNVISIHHAKIESSQCAVTRRKLSLFDRCSFFGTTKMMKMMSFYSPKWCSIVHWMERKKEKKMWIIFIAWPEWSHLILFYLKSNSLFVILIYANYSRHNVCFLRSNDSLITKTCVSDEVQSLGLFREAREVATIDCFLKPLFIRSR